ncbi:MAG: rhodanese-like domain-containing protein [Peptococcaceae bacterium]|nr:rhodanese-like domain-containing protein [Peptococcaceae bacterium]
MRFYLRQGQIALLPEEKRPYHKLYPQDLKRLLREKEDFLLLDVRTKLEYEAEHIPQSIHLDIAEAETQIPILAPNQTTKIVIYCHGGERSIEMAEKLHQLGYSQLYYLHKGISQWYYATEKSATSNT